MAEKNNALEAYANEHAMFKVGDIVRDKSKNTVLKITKIYAEYLASPIMCYEGAKLKKNGEFSEFSYNVYSIKSCEIVKRAGE